jgi:type IV secretory pathway VirB3-like protein
MSIWGIPRIALMVAVLISTAPFPILAFAIDQLIALIVCVSLFGISWIVMKVISINDPDYILIATLRLFKLSAKYQTSDRRYVA